MNLCRTTLPVPLLLLALSSCVFDDSRLGECRNDGECAQGTCQDRVCVPTVTDARNADAAEDGAPDGLDDVAEEPDVGADLADMAGDLTDVELDRGRDAGDAERDLSPCPAPPFCDGSEAVRCTLDGVLERVDCDRPETCPRSDLGCYCEAGSCEARICLAGQLDCVDDQVVQCDVEGAGFVVQEICEAGEICEEGDCEPATCEPDTSSRPSSRLLCLGEVLVNCTVAGAVEVVEDCRLTDAYCDADALDCEPTACQPDERRCGVDGESGLEVAEQCDGRGIGFDVAEICRAGQTCIAGQCQGEICTPGSVGDCFGDSAISVCADDGLGFVIANCGEGRYCDGDGQSAECRDGACRPESRRCLPTEEGFQACNASGSAYESAVLCNDAQFCQEGACTDQVCVPGDIVCDDDFTLRYCDERGSAEVVEACGDGDYCDDGGESTTCEPQLCQPNVQFCNLGGNVAVCDSRGATSAELDVCDDVCFEGACREPFCGDGVLTPADDEECDDRNQVACDGCEACEWRFAAQLSTDVTSTERPTWLPGESLLTLEVWTRPMASGQLVGVGLSDQNHVRLGVAESGFPVFFYELGGSQTVEVVGDESIVDGAWHHVAGVRTASDDAALYVDGELVATIDENRGNTSLDDDEIWIGSDGTLESALAGLDEVRISDVARYTGSFEPARRLVPDDDTIALYHLDRGMGSTVVDTTSNDRHLTLLNADWLEDDCYGGLFVP